ncbi:unnamed protein product [Chrysoparadoxa australica]
MARLALLSVVESAMGRSEKASSSSQRLSGMLQKQGNASPEQFVHPAKPSGFQSVSVGGLGSYPTTAEGLDSLHKALMAACGLCTSGNVLKGGSGLGGILSTTSDRVNAPRGAAQKSWAEALMLHRRQLTVLASAEEHKANDPAGHARALALASGNVASTCLVMGMVDEAIEHFEEQLEAGGLAGDILSCACAQRGLSECHQGEGDLEAALKHLKAYHKLTVECNNRELQVDACRQLSALYSSIHVTSEGDLPAEETSNTTGENGEAPFAEVVQQAKARAQEMTEEWVKLLQGEAQEAQEAQQPPASLHHP